MPAQTTISAMILVQAAPVLTADADEQMCVAGMRLDRPGKWVRLFPVPFRDLDDEAKFKKYQEIAVDVIQPPADRRPESMTPVRGSTSLGEVIDSRDRWARRRRRVAQLPERTMCELVEMNRNQQTEDAPSLGVIRLAGPPRFRILESDAEQVDRWEQRAREQASKPSLFDDPDVSKQPLNIVPWRFMYSYRCLADDCRAQPNDRRLGVDRAVPTR